MPPEPLPWDRKDFFRDRKHSHSDRPSDALGPVSSRWRDSPSSSSSFHGSRNNGNGDFPRWGGFNSDFRRPPGHGKQGGWHPYPEDSSHGYPPARSVDRFSADDGFWPSGARGDGRCAKSYRDNRVSFGQKNWRSHSWDNNNHHSTLANTPRRPHNVNNQQLVDVSPTRASVLHRGLVDTLHQPPSKDQPEKLKDQPDKPRDQPEKPKDQHVRAKDLHDKPKDLHDTSNDVNGPSTNQRVDGESLLGSIDWKPLKWSRSGSLTSRGSGFSHSSSSKSIGGESNEPKNELPSTSATASESPPTDTATCSIHASALEDTSSRKKPRLGWGEGLAKYEKKKVEDPEDNLNKNDNTSCAANVEIARSHSYSLADKSPKFAGLSACASPATPSSVGCSSSPAGLEEKTFGKVTDLGVDASNLRLSYAPGSYNHLKEYPFNVEKLQFESISTLTALLNELLQCVDRSSIDSGFVKSSALGKLLLWKGDLSKAVEVIESEIDMLETELKSLKSEAARCDPCLVSSSSLSMDYREKPHEDASTIQRPPPLEFVSSGGIVEDIVPCTNIVAEAHAEAKEEDIESPGTATSKFSELLPVGKLECPEGEKGTGSDVIGESSNIEVHAPDVEKTRISANEGSKIIQSGSCMQGNGIPYHDGECNLCGSILASNNEIAKRASEVFVKLLPRCDYHIDAFTPSCEESEERNLLIKKKFLTRKRFSKFKERVISLKYRALQYLWYEDLRSLSLRKSRARLQRRSDLALRTLNNGHQKYRSIVRSRFSSPAYGNLGSVPTSEIAAFTRKLLSDTPVVKHYRDSLKMPALILDEREKKLSRFVSSNGLVEDPCAVEKERALINPWTAEEREIFIEKLATFGKDFRKIASFLDHKTTADCIEFYYKNHKSDCFVKTKKKPEFKKEGKLFSTSTYMVTSGNRWSNRDMNAASLDILGAASAIAAHDEGIDSEKLLSGPFNGKRMRGFDGVLERSSSFDVENERDNAAADVLAGICGSLSSEAMSSCITSSVDPGEGCQELKCQRVGSSFRRPLTPEVTQSMDDDTCSDESCGEMDPVDWTDEEKSLFLQAFSFYGKDFATISRRIQTKSRDECKVFFSKARKSLGLDMIQRRSGNERAAGSNDANEGGSDTEDAYVVETGSVVCSDKSGSKIDEDFATSPSNTNHADSIADGRAGLLSEMNILSDNCDPGQVDDKDTEVKSDILIHPVGNQVHNVSEPALDGDGLVSDSEEDKSVRVSDQERTSGCDDLECGEEFARGHQRSVVGGVEAVAETGCHGIAAAPIERKDAEVSNGTAESEMENGDAKNDDMHLATFDFKGPGCGRQEFSGPSESKDGAHQKVLLHHSVEDGNYSQVLQGHPLDFLTQNGDVSWTQVSPASTVSTEKRPMTTPNFYLRRCNRTASQNSVAQLHFPSKSEGHKTDSGHCVSEKQCKNGDVKLFGQILSKSVSQEKPSSVQRQDDDDAVSPSSCGKLDMKSAHDIERNSSISNYDHNFPVRSYGFWDGSRIRTGFATLPDSALLMPKYSAPISDYTVSSARLERQALKTATSTNDCNLSALPVDCNNVTHSDYQAYKSQNGVRPFTLDMKQKLDLYSDDQRNGFEMGSSIQPQEKGKRVIKLMGPCSGVSDPVAALKLHYARTEQPSGQSGSVTGKEESWRGQGDVGR